MQPSSEDFNTQRAQRIKSYSDNQNLQISAHKFFLESVENLYSYNFSWMGLPIIQYPQDLIALQEIIYETKPTLIIETGFARGGSALFFMSMMHMANNLNKQSFKLVSLDIAFNKEALKSVESSKFADNFYHLEASSTSEEARDFVSSLVAPEDKVMVILDSMHTADHVLKELKIYSPLVSSGCYCVVLDTVIEHLPKAKDSGRPWGPGNSPLTAVKEFLSEEAGKSFVTNEQIDNKLLISVGKFGYLQRL